MERVALVTGGSRGIGHAIARALLDRGMRVAITGRDRASLDLAARTLAAPDRLLAVPADVGRFDDVQRCFETVAGKWGRLDVLVNNAGIGGFANVAEMGPELWRSIIDTNLTGVYYCCHAAIPHLRRAGGGWIINISSLAGKNAFPGGAAYCASKAGLNAFSEALMQEIRYDGIRVSYIMPGSVYTGFRSPGAGKSAGDEQWMILPEDIAATVVELVESPARTLASRIEMRPSQPKKR
jgi:NAD(P)-dependent dehydrogenase (short-subunit alcohol dehydrogenase family)